jgi:pimeloyl-ACP methyl ester carboxylesterase
MGVSGPAYVDWQEQSRLFEEISLHEPGSGTLTGLGERSHLLHPGINLDTHIADVVGVLKYEGLTDAILAGHSYGGMVITGVADRALSRVAQLVYLDAAMPVDGESLAIVAQSMMDLARRQARIVDGVELVLWPDSDAVRHYGVTDPDDFAWMQAKLTPHPWKCFEQPLHLANQEAVKRIPRTNINCTSTLRIRPPERRQRASEADRVWEIDTGHDLMITEPQAVAEMLLRLASL